MSPVSPLRRSAATSILAAAVLLIGIATAPAGAGAALSQSPAPRILGAGSASAIPGSYIVTLKDNASLQAGGVAARAQALSAEHKGKVEHVYTKARRGFSVAMSENEARKLAAEPHVASVMQDQYVKSITADDALTQQDGSGGAPNLIQPVTSETWALDRIDQRKPPLDAKYHYADALAGDNVTAYVISTGIRITHEQFAGRASFGPNFRADGKPNADDCEGTGTFLAGVIGGTEFGVAKKVELVSVRVVGCNGIGQLSEFESAIDWVAANAVKPAVALNSLQICADPETGDEQACLPDVVASVVESQENLVASGVVLVAGAGNKNRDACINSLGIAPSVLYAGGTSFNDVRMNVSNFGPCVDIWAPAEAITSASVTSDVGELTFSHPVIAAAFVAGAAAVLKSDPKFVNASSATVIDQLVNKQSTKDVISGLDGSSFNKFLFTNPPGGFTVGSSVKLAPNSDGRLSLFGTNSGGFILQRTQAPLVGALPAGGAQTDAGAGNWGAWIQSSTKGWESVAAGRHADGRIELVGLTQTHELWHRRQSAPNSTTWLSWSQLDSPTALGIDAVSVKLLTNNRLMMFGANQDGRSYFRTQTAANASTWGSWTPIAFSGQARSVTAESNTDGRIEVFVADVDGQVWHSKQITATDTNWSVFTQITGSTTMGVLAAARNSNGKVDVFGTDDNGSIWHATQTAAGATSYGTWTRLTFSGKLKSVTAEANAVDRIHVVAVDTAGKIWESLQTAAGATTYSAFTLLDGQLRP